MEKMYGVIFYTTRCEAAWKKRVLAQLGRFCEQYSDELAAVQPFSERLMHKPLHKGQILLSDDNDLLLKWYRGGGKVLGLGNKQLKSEDWYGQVLRPQDDAKQAERVFRSLAHLYPSQV